MLIVLNDSKEILQLEQNFKSVVDNEIEKINKEDGWLSKSFLFERKNLYRQISLFYHCDGNEKLSKKYLTMSQAENAAQE